MKLGFHRQRGIDVILPDPRDGRRRGFYFALTLAVTAPVDPQSGMTVNLVHVDDWLGRIAEKFPSADGIFPWLRDAGAFTASLVAEKTASLVSLQLTASAESWLHRPASTDGPRWECAWRFESLGPAEASTGGPNAGSSAGVQWPCLREIVLSSEEALPSVNPAGAVTLSSGVAVEKCIAAGWPAVPAGWSWKEIREGDPAGRVWRNFSP